MLQRYILTSGLALLLGADAHDIRSDLNSTRDSATSLQVSVIPWHKNTDWHLTASRVEGVTQSAAPVIDLVWWWRDLEPAPGEYAWENLDRAFDALAHAGKRIKLTVTMHEGNIPPWLGKGESQLDQNGEPLRLQHSYTLPGGYAPSLHSARARKAFLALISAIIDRYSSRNELVAWQFAYGWHEIPHFDRRAAAINPNYHEQAIPTGFVYDYSPAAQVAWREYWRLQGFTIDQLNLRWSTQFKRWEEIAIPIPDYRRPVDVRPYWLDHLTFKRETEAQFALQIARTVRERDSRPLVFWGISDHRLATFPSIYGDVAAVEVPHYRMWANRVRLQDGLNLYAEPGKIPPDPYHVSLGLFNALQYGANGFLMAGYYRPNHPGARQFERLRPLFTDLANGEPVKAELALLYSETSQWAIQKSSAMRDFDARLYLGMHNALTAEGVTFDTLMDTAPLKLDQYRLIIDLDNAVHTPDTIRAIERAVRQGSNLILMGNSGRYCTDGSAYKTLRTLGNYPTQLPTYVNDGFRRINSNLVEANTPGEPLIDRIHVEAGGSAIKDDAGRPYSYHWQYGKGTVTWILGKPNVSHQALTSGRSIIKNWLKQSGIVPRVNVEEGIQATVLADNHTILLFNEGVSYWSFGNQLGTYSPRFHKSTPRSYILRPILSTGTYRVFRNGRDVGRWNTNDQNGIKVELSPYELTSFRFIKQ